METLVYRTRDWIVDQIRRDHQLNPDTTPQQLAVRHRASLVVVAEALSLPVPVRRRSPQALLPEPVKDAIDRMLLQDLNAPPDTRHMISRIIERLRTEENFTSASYSTVRDYVAARRTALATERGTNPSSTRVKR
ncbi:hypothetical protein ABZ883_42245 [Streptomyces sp. NPDC046977]|uniref:hypothetical protein n=1 Tax=Streptomyces sp. NPDC046977 TaxID=3154703 RepID=UPI0033CA4D05